MRSRLKRQKNGRKSMEKMEVKTMNLGKKTKKQSENYLDYVPKQNALFPYTIKENARVEIKVKNRGMFHGIARILFGRPRYSYIELDEFGSFVWQQIDGKRTIYEICMLIKDRFGEKAEPLFERAVQFFKILRSNSFIVYINKCPERGLTT